MAKDAMEPRYSLGSVERALRVLAELERNPNARLAELSRALEANSTTVLRALRVLEDAGFVRRSGPDTYALGTRLVELGLAASQSLDLPREVHSGLVDLARLFNVTAHIGMLRDQAITIVGKIDPPSPLVRYSTLGSRMPLHASAAGKAALALQHKATGMTDLSTMSMEAFTDKTITDSADLLDDIVRTGERRYSVEESEFQVGFSCVGSAIQIGGEIYTLSLSGPHATTASLSERGTRLVDFVQSFHESHRSVSVAL